MGGWDNRDGDEAEEPEPSANLPIPWEQDDYSAVPDDTPTRPRHDAFTPAPSYQAGATHYCHKLARLFDISVHNDACPISALLFDGPEIPTFRSHADALFQRLIEAVAAHAQRFGMTGAQARDQAETLLITVEGGWTLARARRRSDILRSLPARLFPGPG